MMNPGRVTAGLLVGVVLTLTACKESNEGLVPQSHDDNVYQQINHRMMDEMDKMTATNDPDHDFAMMMQMHHQSAIEMSNEELKSGDNQAMKDLAQRVITAQTAEKSTLGQFLQSRTPVVEPDGPSFHMEAMISMDKMMKAQDIRILTGDSDVDYAQLLIDHHQSALEMATAELSYGDDEQIRTMARRMIEDQKKEITELQDWLKANKNY